ncbi:MAG: hypothetical protein JRH11_08635 [Deltaproteobacteria bacterium]|nr:hypothetical protein [Deltaproteobacteria bacterium]
MGGLCSVQFLDASGSPTGAGICPFEGGCDPLTQRRCTPPEACYFSDSEGGTRCGVAGTAAEGETCDFVDDCAAGLQCATDTCRAFCDIADAEPDCPVGAECTDFGGGLPWGLCVPTE